MNDLQCFCFICFPAEDEGMTLFAVFWGMGRWKVVLKLLGRLAQPGPLEVKLL